MNHRSHISRPAPSLKPLQRHSFEPTSSSLLAVCGCLPGPAGTPESRLDRVESYERQSRHTDSSEHEHRRERGSKSSTRDSCVPNSAQLRTSVFRGVRVNLMVPVEFQLVS